MTDAANDAGGDERVDGAPERGGGFLGKLGLGWRLMASWMMPAIMGLAYAFMALTAETDTTGKAWMALGFVFVLVVWWIFRITTTSAAMARAVAVGDAARILELLPASAMSPLARSQRAFAYELRGDWAAARTEASAAQVGQGAPPAVRVAAAAVEVGAAVELGQIAEARAVFERVLAPHLAGAAPYALAQQARLAQGRLAWAEGDAAAATVALEKVTRDVRAGAAARAIAHTYAARIADAAGDAAAAAGHRREVAQLAPGSWMARAS